MIDIENKMFGIVKSAVQASYPKASLASVQTNSPKTLPFVSEIMIDDYEHKESMDSSMKEKYADCVFEVNVYTSGDGKKTLAKSIVALIDSAMKGEGFSRKSYAPMSTSDDTTFRCVLRYEGIVSTEKAVYRR